MTRQCTLTIVPDGIRISTKKNTYIKTLLDQDALHLNYFCGGKGKCGKCRVQFLENPPEATEVEESLLSLEELDAGVRLACVCKLRNDATIQIPEASLPTQLEKAISDKEIAIELNPSVRKVALKLSPQTLEKPLGDWELVARELSHHGIPEPRISHALLTLLPDMMRAADYHLTATLHNDDVIRLEESDTTVVPLFGLAVDVGTTTVSASLLDLRAGSRLFSVSRLNPQTVFGADLISRIAFASEQEGNLQKLKDALGTCVKDLAGRLCKKAGITLKDIVHIACAGNSTMEHLLLGITPEFIGRTPFCPAFSDGLETSGDTLHKKFTETAKVFVFPVIGGFVGGDIVADMLVTDIANGRAPALLVDIGTNGEVALAKDGTILAASAAAGPAFEGAQISQGMYAAPGAIDHFSLKDGSLHFTTVDNKPAAGICGSGLIDIVAELLQHGIIEPSGRILEDAAPNDTTRKLFKERMAHDASGVKILLVRGEASGGKDVYITQSDVRQIQLAKGAIATAISTLMSMMDVQPDELGNVYLAGAFGNYIKEESAVTIGLLPQIGPDKIEFIGDAALAGAEMALLNTTFLSQANRLARMTQFVELAATDDFQERFVDNLPFPDTL